MESATLSINLAILMSRFDSPPQSCVVSVIWTCKDTDQSWVSQKKESLTL